MVEAPGNRSLPPSHPIFTPKDSNPHFPGTRPGAAEAVAGSRRPIAFRLELNCSNEIVEYGGGN